MSRLQVKILLLTKQKDNKILSWSILRNCDATAMKANLQLITIVIIMNQGFSRELQTKTLLR